MSLLLLFLFIFISFLSFSSKVLALPADISPSPKNTVSQLESVLNEEDIPSTLEEVNKANLPKDVKLEKSDEMLPFTAGQYNIASSRYTAEKTPATVVSFLKNLFSNILDILGLGNKKADEFASAQFPKDTGIKLFTQKTQGFAQMENKKVLGIFGQKDNVMIKSLPMVQRAYLPLLPTSAVLVSPTVSETPISPPMPVTSVSPFPSAFPSIAPITPGAGLGLYYEFPFHKGFYSSSEIDSIASSLLDKMSVIVQAVLKKWPTSMISHWREIYDSAVSQDWNPAFVLAIWIEETAASDVCSLGKRLGVNGIYDFGYSAGEKTYCSDSLSVRLAKLRYQRDKFLGLYETYKTRLKKESVTFEEFMCLYSEGHFPCTFDLHPGFLQRLPTVYNCLVHPNPSSSVCPSGYFSF